MDILSNSSSSFEDEEIWIGPVNKEYTARIFNINSRHITAKTRRKTFAGFEETTSFSPQKTVDDLSFIIQDREPEPESTKNSVGTSCLLTNIDTTSVNNTIWNNSDPCIIFGDDDDNEGDNYAAPEVKLDSPEAAPEVGLEFDVTNFSTESDILNPC